MKDSGSLKNKLVILSLAGFLFGMIICIIFCVYDVVTEGASCNQTELIIEIIGSGIYGAIAMGGSIVYDIESWGLRRATLVHYILVMVSFLITNFLLGWFEKGSIIIIILIMTIIYLFIWFIMYFIWKKEIRKMNEDLKEFIENKKEEE